MHLPRLMAAVVEPGSCGEITTLALHHVVFAIADVAHSATFHGAVRFVAFVLDPEGYHMEVVVIGPG